MTDIITLEKSNISYIIEKVIEAIKLQKIVIIPTDTIHGFFAPYNDSILSSKIRDIKNRDTKPFIYLVNSIEMLEKYSKTQIHQDIKKLLPAPVTLVVESAVIKTSDNSVAFRYADNNLIQRVIDYFNVPFISTSVNKSGEASINEPEEIVKKFAKDCGLIVTTQNSNNIASSIIDIRTKPYKIIRKGNLPENLFK